MLRAFFERIIRTYKNPEFSFDDRLTSVMFLSFILKMIAAVVRGFRLLLFFRWPKFLFLGRGVAFQYLSRIRIGKWVVIGDFVTLGGFPSAP